MNAALHRIGELRCEVIVVSDVVRALLHTILFTRSLGVVKPKIVRGFCCSIYRPLTQSPALFTAWLLVLQDVCRKVLKCSLWSMPVLIAVTWGSRLTQLLMR